MRLPSVDATPASGGEPGSSGDAADADRARPEAAAAGQDPLPGAEPEHHHTVYGTGVEIGALLLAAALLRLGVVAGTDAVIYDLNDLYSDRPPSIAVGLVGASQAFAEMVLAMILARQADRFGRRRFLVGGPILGAVGILLVALATHPAAFAAARVLEGIGAAAFVPTALSTVASATTGNPKVRARASGAFEGATLVGYAGGFIVGSNLWHIFHRWSFVLFACFYLAAAAISARFVERVPPMHVSSVATVARAIAGRGPIRIFIPAWLAVNSLVGAWYINMTSLLKHAPEGGQTLVGGFDERVIGLMKLSFVLLLIVGIVLWTPFLQRHGGPATMRRTVPAVFLVCAALAVVNHAPLRYSPLILPLVVLGIIGMSGFVPAAVNYLTDCSESLVADRAALMAFYTVTLAAGSFVGASLGGVIAKFFLFDGLLVLGVVLGTVAVVSLDSVKRYEAVHGSAREHSIEAAEAASH